MRFFEPVVSQGMNQQAIDMRSKTCAKNSMLTEAYKLLII